LEPLTHFLTGAVLSRAGFNRKTAMATAAMTIAAELPDIDIFWRSKGPVYYFAHHRGFTHSFLGLLLMSAVTVGFMYLVWLIRGRRTSIPDLPPRWGLLFLFSYIAGLSHILLDFTNNYGVRPFWPFWEKWYSWDIVFIFEPALYIILVLALILPGLFSFHSPRPRGRKAARIALACLVLFYAFRDHEHRDAVHALRGQQFTSNGSQPVAPIRVSVYPYYWYLTRWYAVAETPTFFASSDMNSRNGELDRSQLVIIPKPPETPATLAAKKSYLGRVYLDWAQYPLANVSAEGEDTMVRLRDLRYDYPRLRGRITLSCSVALNKDLQVVREFFGSQEQQPPAQ
jgi:inner membrane protein